MRREKRFTYEQDADFRVGNESDWLHAIASRIEGQKILVRGQNIGSHSLAQLIANLLNKTEKVYLGERTKCGCGVGVQVCFQGVIITSYTLPNVDRTDSPDGFEWGFGGSGPSALAWSILEDHLADHSRAEFYHQAFKHDLIEPIRATTLRITASQIDDWLFRHEERIAEAKREIRDLKEEVGRP